MLLRRIYYGWFIVITAGAAEFANAASSITVLTIFVIPMTDEFGWSRTEISGATSIGALIGATIAPLIGRIVDRLGSRLVLVVGGLAVAGSCFYLAAAQTLLGFYIAFTVARTADQGLIKIGTTPVVAKWFYRFRGRAISSVFFMGMLGVLVMVPAVQFIISEWGWRAAWVVLGAVMVAVGVMPSLLFMRRRPEDMGLFMDGMPPIQNGGQKESGVDGSFELELDVDLRWRISLVIRTPAFWLILTSLFVISTASSGVILHLMPYLTEESGISAKSAVGVISGFTASGAFATLAIGAVSDRLPPRLLMASSYLVSAAAMGLLIITDSLPEAYLFAVLQGFAAIGINLTSPILLAEYYGRWTIGSMYGIVRAAQVAGFAIGALISGVVYDSTGSYQLAFFIFLFIALISACFIFVAKKPNQNQRRTSSAEV